MIVRKSKRTDTVITEIERVLKPGRFVRYDPMSEFVMDLEKMAEKLATIVDTTGGSRVVGYYEVFLAGCYLKIEEVDDSCDGLGMFFHELFCGWIKSRQAAEMPAKDTVAEIVNWMEKDDYGFCYRIEKDIGNALDQNGYEMLTAHFRGLIDKVLEKGGITTPRAIFKYPNEVRLPAMSLKDLSESRRSARDYEELCDRLGFSPRDCERLAKIETTRRRWKEALAWVDKGLGRELDRDWLNEKSLSLPQLKLKILGKLGRREEALETAWADFENHPSDFTYEELMRFVPKGEKLEWRERAITVAISGDLADFIDLCVKAREWARLADRIDTAKQTELESISHYSAEPAAKGLSKKHPPAAATLYQAMGLRIVNKGKSKYYDIALQHLKRARRLYLQCGRDSNWEEIVEFIRSHHSRKRGFMVDFEEFMAGKPKKEHVESFYEKARSQWKKQTSS